MFDVSHGLKLLRPKGSKTVENPHVLRVLVRQSHVLCKALHELRFPHDLGYFPPVPRDLLSRRLGAITDTAEGACEVNDLSKHMLFLQADIEHA